MPLLRVWTADPWPASRSEASSALLLETKNEIKRNNYTFSAAASPIEVEGPPSSAGAATSMAKKTNRPPGAQKSSSGVGIKFDRIGISVLVFVAASLGDGQKKAFGPTIHLLTDSATNIFCVCGLVSIAFPSLLPDIGPAKEGAEKPRSKSERTKSKLSFDLNKTLERSSKVSGTVPVFVGASFGCYDIRTLVPFLRSVSSNPRPSRNRTLPVRRNWRGVPPSRILPRGWPGSTLVLPGASATGMPAFYLR